MKFEDNITLIGMPKGILVFCLFEFLYLLYIGDFRIAQSYGKTTCRGGDDKGKMVFFAKYMELF